MSQDIGDSRGSANRGAMLGMSKARLVITALFVDHQTPAEVAARYGVHRAWVYKLKARYRGRGRGRASSPAPGARRPHPARLPAGHGRPDHRAARDSWPTRDWTPARTPSPGTCDHHHHTTVSRSTIARNLAAAGLVVPEPKKRPRSSYIRFEAEHAERELAVRLHPLPAHPPRRPTGADVEIISWLDDCSRYALHVTAHPRITGPIVLATFRETVAQHGIPASTLTDNGMVYTTRLVRRPRRTQRLRDTNCAACTSSRRTPAPTTRPPAARSNGSSRP